MTTDLNIDELERLMGEATPLPWLQFGGAIRDSSESRVLICSGVHCKIDVATRDHALIAAAVNALPELIRRVREAEGDARRYQWLTKNAYVGPCYTDRGQVSMICNVEREVPSVGLKPSAVNEADMIADAIDAAIEQEKTK